ncbi:hypothetical protein M378DRAFT_169019 [Amanita muscaria Koide BX008]|uniref:Uncharacterized protein n=1 Tax=Amanita muscaria (strain Koide BX008) TaxID=946122 RepID=A0A0C2SA10_AMAMK|nr:hypothetical protein M378DRAFT_169019 [Amanita muscaria Koide BX008]
MFQSVTLQYMPQALNLYCLLTSRKCTRIIQFLFRLETYCLSPQEMYVGMLNTRSSSPYETSSASSDVNAKE